MKAGEGPARCRVSKQLFEGLVFAVSRPQPISVPYQISPTGMVHLYGVRMDLNAQFIGEVSSGPHVVVAQVPVDVEATVDQFSHLSQKAYRALGDHVTPLKPKVDEVAHQMQGVTLTAYFLEPGQENPFPLP